MLNDTSRRDFLSTAATAAAFAAFPKALLAAKSPNEKIHVALIGCGGRGMHVAGLFHSNPNTAVTLVCDADEIRRAAAAKRFNVPATNVVGDLRKALDDKSIDVALITTPDHWHAPASILACAAGKHVYVEKPISHNVREGRLLVEAAERNRVHVQHGTQSRSTGMMAGAVDLLRKNLIGDVLVAKCWNIQKRGSIGRGEETAVPAGLDYDTWVGPATMIPYRSNRVHHRWTWWYHFGCGDMGNDGVHDIDYTRWGLGVDTHPTKVSAIGGKYFQDDDQEFPDTQQVAFEFSPIEGQTKPRMLIYEQRLWSTNYPYNVDSGAEFYGTNGQMFLSRRGKLQVMDAKNKPVPVDVKAQPMDDAAHVRNLLASVRGDETPNANALTGHLSSSLCHLGNIATRVSRTLHFDPKTEQILGDDEANSLLRREYRDHWGRPTGA